MQSSMVTSELGYPTEAGMDPPLRRRTPPPPPSLLRRFGLPIWIAIALATIGAIAGIRWQQSIGTTSEATVRVAFEEDVGFGNLDAERSLLVDAGSEARVESDLGVEIEIIAPEARSFIDVVAEAETDEAALRAARAVADDLIAVSVSTETADAQIKIDEAADAIELLEAEIASMEAMMAEEAAIEASAKARLTQELSVEEREALVVEERAANDRYWAIARERNSVLDQQNGFVRARTSAEAEQRTAGNLRFVEQARMVPSEGLDPVTSAGIGGALLGLGLASFGLWVALRRSGD